MKAGYPHNGAEYYTLNGKKYVPCAFGSKAASYKNIQADPRVTVQTAKGTESMRAVRVTEGQELLEVIELFRHRNSFLTTLYLESVGIKPDRSNLLEKKDRVYVLRFDPTTKPTPPALKADLNWVWPVVDFLALVIGWAGKRLRS